VGYITNESGKDGCIGKALVSFIVRHSTTLTELRLNDSLLPLITVTMTALQNLEICESTSSGTRLTTVNFQQFPSLSSLLSVSNKVRIRLLGLQHGRNITELELRRVHDCPEEPRLVQARPALDDASNPTKTPLLHTLEAALDVFPQLKYVTIRCDGLELDRVLVHCTQQLGADPGDQDEQHRLHRQQRQSKLRQLLLHASLEDPNSEYKTNLTSAAFGHALREFLEPHCDLFHRIFDFPECDAEFLTTYHPRSVTPIRALLHNEQPADRVIAALERISPIRRYDPAKHADYLLPLAIYDKKIMEYLLKIGVPVNTRCAEGWCRDIPTAFSRLCLYGERYYKNPDTGTF
jgi:hypothetical protein